VKLVIVGKKIGKTKLKPIAWIDVTDDGDLFVDALNEDVQDDVLALTNRQLEGGGFFVQMGAADPQDESRHRMYSFGRDPTQRHFDEALKATVAIAWTGERVGNYEINGFASYVED
jgi:hypothetical protein